MSSAPRPIRRRSRPAKESHAASVQSCRRCPMTRLTLIDAPLINAGKALSSAAGTLAVATAAALLSLPSAAEAPTAPAASTAKPDDSTPPPQSDANSEWVMVGAIARRGHEKPAEARDASPALPTIDDDGR